MEGLQTIEMVIEDEATNGGKRFVISRKASK